MNSLELFHLCKKVARIPLNRGIRTDAVLFRRGRVSVQDLSEPGINHRKAFFRDENGTAGLEDILDEEVDVMNIDKAYDLNQSEMRRNKMRLQRIIIGKKFFAPRTQPLMLTCNERECIKYLHKQDPVQWNLKTLSESFPATVDVIKKVIKAKWKITPERAKLLDQKAQKNWELLAAGKLDADPDVLEHFKKFINRRETLLEQIKNVQFYLPEVKREPVWNKGEFSNILGKYEKAVEKLVKESEMKQTPKALEDGTEREGGAKEEKSSLEFVRGEINEASRKPSLENKDSFLFGDVTKFYSKHTTLEELEGRILKRADANKRLNVWEKAILETKLDVRNNCSPENLSKTATPTQGGIEEDTKQPLEAESGPIRDRIDESDVVNQNRSGRMKFRKSQMTFTLSETGTTTPESIEANTKKTESRLIGGRRNQMMEFQTEYVSPDERTLCSTEVGIGQLLRRMSESGPTDEKPKSESENLEKSKPKIDFSDPERVRRENVYYDNQVTDIEQTAFWGSRSSRVKALDETEKRPHDGPVGVDRGVNPAGTMVFSTDPYPERIKIPKSKQKSGLTYKVKDCYYDDDGEFLYRVPGMKN